MFIFHKTKLACTILKVVIIDLSMFEKKEQKIGTNLSKKNYIITKKLENEETLCLLPFSKF